MTKTTKSKIIVALDFSDETAARSLVDQLEPGTCQLKVGKEMFTRSGPAFVEKLVSAGFDVFLDLKYHDIPNTVAAACDAAADLGVWMINVHASGGRRMMEAASERLAKRSESPFLIAVTVLTSMTDADLNEVGIQASSEEQVLHLAGLTRSAGLDGVVCSPLEATPLRQQMGNDFLLITPGVRPKSAAMGDQRRVMTPSDAVAAGADYLVIGRPITAADSPIDALRAINAELLQKMA